MECSIKRFPLGQYSQTVVHAALEARTKIRSAEEIAEVRIETGATAVRLMAGEADKWAPTTRETADHSMPYTVAVALIHGTVAEHHFGNEYLYDPDVRALTQRVKVEVSDEANRRMPEAMLCKLTIVTKDGRQHTAVVEYHKGHWKNPMSDSEVEAKFRSLAEKVQPRAATDRLLETIWKLENLADAGDLVRLTTGG
jgi:2-methylcitrate dehydratase